MDIVIVRHGQAEAYASSDAKRPLTPRGVTDAGHAGECLAELGLQFDAVWVSPYLRTQQTAQQLLAYYPHIKPSTYDWLTPETSPKQVFEYIQRSGLASLLIISHQPLVSALVAYMAVPNGYGPAMAPASMAYVINRPNLPGCGELKWLRHAPEHHSE